MKLRIFPDSVLSAFHDGKGWLIKAERHGITSVPMRWMRARRVGRPGRWRGGTAARSSLSG
jgi:hypothetical protein